jgi:hypothetical protein
MPYFFTPNPTVGYDPLNTNRRHIATDITRRFKVENIIKSPNLIFYDYMIKDRDRPDIIADKYYGDSTLDWLVFIVNNIFDPYFQWPLNDKQFNDYIVQKYGSSSVAMAQTHHYEKTIQARQEYTNPDGERLIIPERFVEVDQTTYTATSPSLRRIITNYEFEEHENNRKRSIKLLEAAFVPAIIQQFDEIYRT